jgi:4a-hydroxytetrahydrobiopterin dehydratase
MALSPDELTQALRSLPDWKAEGEAIVKEFPCDDFTHAMDFANHVAELAEEQDHHPDLEVRYSSVTVRLSTHSEGGVTEADLKLAKAIENL